MWYVIVIIFFAGMALSVGTFLLQYYGFCPVNPALPGSWPPVAYTQRRVSRGKEEGLPVEVIARLKSYDNVKDVPFKLVPLEAESEQAAEEEECLICQEEMGTGKVTQLTCGHIFHKTCIANWLKRKASCPCCRQCVTKESIDGTAPSAMLAPDVEMGVVKQHNSCADEHATCCQDNSTEAPATIQCTHDDMPEAQAGKAATPAASAPVV